jgi:two-component system osmolarity sensor histidine kinase EnvZ
MLAGISHDLRTPLTRMTLQLAMLPPSDATAALQQDVKEMEHMVEEYLAFARGEDGEQSQQVNLQKWLDDMLEPYRNHGKPVSVSKVPQRNITLRPQAMQRAIRNLVDNALTYGNQCWVTVEVRRRHLRLRVEDDGPGIPQEDYDRAFQAFERLDKARNSETGGAGLGLSIVRDIIHSHGGDISLSHSHHGGLLVLIELPL